MAIKYRVETNASDGEVCCKFRLGDLYDTLDHGKPEDQEELLVYLARILNCQTYNHCFVGLAGDDQSILPFNPEHEFTVQYWRSQSKPPIAPERLHPFFRPEFLENIYSFKAYHADKFTVQEVIEQCLCTDQDINDPAKVQAAQTFYHNLANYSMISPPDLVLPHDNTENKVFYQYRTKSASNRFDDFGYCAQVKADLRDILRVLKLHLYSDGVLFHPYFDDVIGMYRSGCVFVNIVCNDTFYYASADAEAIPVYYFNWVMSFLEEETIAGDYVGSAITAACSWLRQCQLPLERYATEKFKQYLERLCIEHGKPWEIAAPDVA